MTFVSHLHFGGWLPHTTSGQLQEGKEKIKKCHYFPTFAVKKSSQNIVVFLDISVVNFLSITKKKPMTHGHNITQRWGLHLYSNTRYDLRCNTVLELYQMLILFLCFN